eukprot:GDKI01017621.1.p1 GENE.GDKI01017621.1~~GDKI01017621.1.p1  ORF type:complete len:268 (-),score=88.41 GDKI01017621.1:265-1008(-)
MSTRRGYSVLFVGNCFKDGHVEYQVKVTDPDNESWFIQKRYREFRELHDVLKLKYPQQLTSFPPKKFWGNNEPAFVQQRQQALQAYMTQVVDIEPNCETKSIRTFLSITPKPEVPVAAPSAEGFIERVNQQLIDLSQSPQPLDPGEVDVRLKKYGLVVQEVCRHPIDPIDMKVALDPLPGPTKNYPMPQDVLEQLSQNPYPNAQADDAMMDRALDDLKQILSSNKKLEGVEKLLVPFPDSLPDVPGA